MKRIYKGSDLSFNLSVNNVPINMKLIKSIKFKFYTLNPTNYIEKSEIDVDKDNQIVLQWHELENLEQGVLYYDYMVSLLDESMIDKSRDNVENVMTDYYIVTHIEGGDINLRTVKWGNVVGDINLLLDLIDYIKTQNYTKEQSDAIFAKKQDKLVSGTNIKTINGESILGHTDIKVATPADIDKTNTLINKVAQTKADTTYVNEELAKKVDKVIGKELSTNDYTNEEKAKLESLQNYDDTQIKADIAKKQDKLVSGTNIKTINGNDIIGSGNLLIGGGEVGKVDRTPNAANHGEIFNCYGGDYINKATSQYSHAEGAMTTASGERSHTEGGFVTASGQDSHAEGNHTTASGNYGAHAEGGWTTASGESSHAEGNHTIASGDYGSHAEGGDTLASGQYSHAEGKTTKAKATYSHAEGNQTIASGQASHAEGYFTRTTNPAEHAEGKFNISNPNTISSIGVGFNGDLRKNAVEVMNDGKVYIDKIGNYDGKLTPTSQSVQDVIKNLTERIAYLESIITNGTINCGNASTK